MTPGYDTSKVLQPDRFKEPYNALMTFAVKDHFIMKNEKGTIQLKRQGAACSCQQPLVAGLRTIPASQF